MVIRNLRVLGGLSVVALLVRFRSGSMRFGRLLVMSGSFVMIVFRHNGSSHFL